MIAIKNIAKFNWNPWVIVGSCVINSSMLYYNETHKGRVENTSVLLKKCTTNLHVYPCTKTIKITNFIEGLPVMSYMSLVFGGFSTIFNIYDTYENVQAHKKYDSGKYSCMCGKM